MTDDELLAFSGEHLFYELEMVFWAGPLALAYAAPESVDQQIIKNALVESFATHLRVLTAFFYDGRKWRDDVIAEDYVADVAAWRAARGPVPEVLKRAAQRTGGEVAHLTRRRHADPGNKAWAPPELIGALADPVRTFVAMTPPTRLDWRVRTLAAELGARLAAG
jgi:hypothetical protein